MRRRMAWARAVAAAGLLAAAACVARPAAAAPRVLSRGWPGPEREVSALLADALRAPGDSLALARARTALLARLQAMGHLDARVSAAWADSGSDAVLRVTTEPGERSRFAPVEVALAGEDSVFVARALAPLAGQFADPARFERALAGALEAIEARGQAWAQLTVSDWRAEPGIVRTRVTGALGPVVQVSDVRVTGLAVTQPALARRAMGRLAKMPYRPAEARAAADRLMQLGVFRRAEFVGLEGGADWREGVLAYRVEEPRYNRIEGAVGLQGEAGVIGLLRLELGNLLGTGRAVALDWQRRGRGLSDLQARAREPLVLGWPLTIEGSVAQQLQDTLYTRDRFGVRGVLNVGARERVEMGLEEERVVQTSGNVRGVDLANTLFALSRDGRDDALSPRVGTRARIAATQVARRERLADGSRSRSRAAALDVVFEAHRRAGPRAGWTLETAALGRLDGDRVLGEYERTPIGGAATLRGHDEEEFRVDRAWRTRLEYRWFLADRGERLHAFWDHAEMETREASIEPGGSRVVRERADGLGLGLRLPAAGGFVDLDYGLAPGRGALEGRIHLRLVTAF